MAKKKKARNLDGKTCGCAIGAVKRSTAKKGTYGKGRGRGFVCLKRAQVNRFVAKNKNGSCPTGSKMKTMTNKKGTKIKRCSKKADGFKFDKMVCK